MSCGVGHRLGLDLALLWLWYRLAAVGLIRPLAWELPQAVGAALKSKKTKTKTKPKTKQTKLYSSNIYLLKSESSIPNQPSN